MILKVKIQYNTISNWVNLAKGEHNCHFCGKTYPWKAALDKHIEKQHQVCPIVHQPSYCKCNKWFRMVKVTEICRGRGPQWFIMTNNSEKKWLLLQKPPQGKRQKRGHKSHLPHIYISHIIHSAGLTSQSPQLECGCESRTDLTIGDLPTTGCTQKESPSRERYRFLFLFSPFCVFRLVTFFHRSSWKRRRRISRLILAPASKQDVTIISSLLRQNGVIQINN